MFSFISRNYNATNKERITILPSIYHKVRFNTQKYCESAFSEHPYFFVSHIVTGQKLYFCKNPELFSFSMPTFLSISTYYASLNKVLSELEVRFSGNDQEILCALEDMCHRKTPDIEPSLASLNFTKSKAKFWKPSRKCARVFAVSAGSIHDCFRNIPDNA